MNKVLKIVEDDIKKKYNKYIGRYYYNYKPKKKINEYFVKDGKEYEVKINNNEIYINYFKMLVTQKIDYLLAKKPSYDKKFDTYNINIWSILDNLMFNASLDGRTWLHIYMQNSELKYLVIKDTEIIPYYSADNTTLEKIIRYYKEGDIIFVEIWDRNNVQRLSFQKDRLINDLIEGHFQIDFKEDGNVTKSIDSGFGEIPFILFENNRDVSSDIYDIECLIYANNSIHSGFLDNIDKFQEALLILKGYIGDEIDVQETLRKIRKSKGVAIDKDGDAGYMTVDIPVEARTVLLNMLRDAIFLIGRGVDPNKLAEGTNITNTVIKSRYIQLDLKSSDSEKRIVEFYINFVDFINKVTRKKFNYDLDMNKTMLINETEQIDNCVKSLNVISLKTILKNHPFIDNVEDELKQIEEEEKVKIEKMKDMTQFSNDSNDAQFNE